MALAPCCCWETGSNFHFRLSGPASQPATWHCLSICVSMHSVTHYSSSAVAVAQPRVRLSRPLLDRLSCSLQCDEPILSRLYRTVKGKGSPYQVVLYTMMLVYRTTCPYSTAERRVPELIPVLGSLQVTWVINPAVGCHYFPPGPQLPSQPLEWLLPVSLLGEQRPMGVNRLPIRLLPDSVAAAI